MFFKSIIKLNKFLIVLRLGLKEIYIIKREEKKEVKNLISLIKFIFNKVIKEVF
jgi:hypothetical protein